MSQDWRFHINTKDQILYLWNETEDRAFIVNRDRTNAIANEYYVKRLDTSIANQAPTIDEWNSWNIADVKKHMMMDCNRIFLASNSQFVEERQYTTQVQNIPIFDTILADTTLDSPTMMKAIHNLPKEIR